MTDEEPLSGGNVGSVVRVGDTVRRLTGPWMPAVHELLRYLQDVGFPYAPRPLGVDEQGREVLSYIEGETVGSDHPWPRWAWADDTLVQAARIMREYHEAVRDFRPDGPRTWRFVVDRVEPGEVVCHNDIAPYNVVYRDGRVVGIIDWDLAGPGTAVWDLAFSAWGFAPIRVPDHARRLGAPLDIGRRLRLLCDSYGLADRHGFIGVVTDRIQASITGIETKAASGEPAFRNLIAGGHLARMQQDAQQVAARGLEWQAALSQN